MEPLRGLIMDTAVEGCQGLDRWVASGGFTAGACVLGECSSPPGQPELRETTVREIASFGKG